jgi:hypothetical protein
MTSRPAKERGKKHSGLAGVLSIVGGVVVLALLGLFLTGKWRPWVWNPLQAFLQNQGIPPIVAIVVTGLLLLIPLGLWVAYDKKAAILRVLPDRIDFVSATLEQFPHLDTEELQRLTEAFESLGFTHLMDYRTKTDLANSGKGFARLFVHPRDHCFAEANQAFAAGGGASEMGCNISSYLEGGWSFSTGSRRPTVNNYLLRRPRALWVGRPGEAPAEILAYHLKRRQQILRGLGAELLTDDSTEGYFERERQAAAERKQEVRKRNLIRFWLDMWLFEKFPKTEWLGDYAKGAGKRKKS